MSKSSSSPFSRPMPGLEVIKGVPMLQRPTPEAVASFPAEARRCFENMWAMQQPLLEQRKYDLKGLSGKHLLLAGATGAGLGGAMATAALHLLGDIGSLTVVGRDLKRSLAYETGKIMQARAEASGLGDRFRWLNSGVELEGKRLAAIVSALKDVGAERVVYVNTVAAASSGMLPGFPPVYVKDVRESDLFQWELPPLDERSIEATKLIMGTMAAAFPSELNKAGIEVEATVFSDWRGSLDRSSRDPASPDYGRQGAYSTSLYLPKEIIQKATAEAYGSGRVVINVFLPMMKTQALSMIPGGTAMYCLYDKILKKEGVERIIPPELALGMLERVGNAVQGEDDNPFPRLDRHEASLDLYFLEVLRRLNRDENSDYYFKKWIVRR